MLRQLYFNLYNALQTGNLAIIEENLASLSTFEESNDTCYNLLNACLSPESMLAILVNELN